MVEDPACNAGDIDLIPGATGELSPCAPTAQPVCTGGLKEKQRNEKAVNCSRRGAPAHHD